MTWELPESINRSEPAGAETPARAGAVTVNRVRLRVWEWGESDRPSVLCAHGAGDHGRMFDGFAPLLAKRGWRVVAVDLRGHGDSGRLSTGEVWSSVALDLGLLARALGPEPIGAVGHSFGGNQLTFAASVFPENFAWVINLNGLGPSEEGPVDVDFAEAAANSVGAARRLVSRPPRIYTDRSDMVTRRAEVNHRLPRAWVEHLVEHGSQPVEGGWAWKLDPVFNLGLPGDFGPEHMAAENELLSRPTLVLTGAEHDTWSEISAQEAERRVAAMPTARHVRIQGAGHYVHVEAPDAVMRAVDEFLHDVRGSGR